MIKLYINQMEIRLHQKLFSLLSSDNLSLFKSFFFLTLHLVSGSHRPSVALQGEGDGAEEEKEL